MRADVSRWVRYYRQARGWTQARLAKKCGTSASYISHLENEDNGIALSTVMRLADAFGEPIEAILYGPLEVRLMDDTHQQKFDEGYRKALEDMSEFFEVKEPTLRKGYKGAGKREIPKLVLRKLLSDPKALEAFRSMGSSCVYRMGTSGEILEIL